jgi:hypothetical protein
MLGSFMLLELELVPVPEAARALAASEVAVPVVRGAADDEEVDVSRTTVLSRPLKRANNTRRIITATARIPRTPPGKVVVVVVVPVVAVLLSVPVTVVPVVVGAGVCVAVAAPASGVPCGALTLPVAPPVVPGVFVFWA